MLLLKELVLLDSLLVVLVELPVLLQHPTNVTGIYTVLLENALLLSPEVLELHVTQSTIAKLVMPALVAVVPNPAMVEPVLSLEEVVLMVFPVPARAQTLVTKENVFQMYLTQVSLTPSRTY
jgi:hypothetical protein